jgi:hypothetical protein
VRELTFSWPMKLARKGHLPVSARDGLRGGGPLRGLSASPSRCLHCLLHGLERCRKKKWERAGTKTRTWGISERRNEPADVARPGRRDRDDGNAGHGRLPESGPRSCSSFGVCPPTGDFGQDGAHLWRQDQSIQRRFVTWLMGSQQHRQDKGGRCPTPRSVNFSLDLHVNNLASAEPQAL